MSFKFNFPSGNDYPLISDFYKRWRQEVFSRMLVCMSLTTEMEDARRDYKQQVLLLKVCF